MQTEREKNRDLFETMPVPKAVARMAVPTVIGQLIVLIYSIADTFFIGRVNDPRMMAGVSLILPIFNLTIAVAAIAGTGGGTLIARLLGGGRESEARTVASFSFWFSLGAGLLFSGLTAAFMRPLLLALGASEDVYDYARQYTSCVIVLGAAPSVLSVTLANLLRNVGCSKQAGFGVSMGGAVNILLDPLFMFVLLPRGREALGAGLATALSNLLSCLYFFIVILRLRSPVLNIAPRGLPPSRRNLGAFFSVGLAAALGPFLFDLDYIVLDRLMAGHGDTALAAIGIVLKAERLPLNVGVGLCLAMVPLAAYNYAAGDLRRMEEILRFTRRVGTLVGIVSILLYELFAPFLVRFFIPDAATVALGSRFLRIRALATIMMFLSFIYVHFFQGIGRGDYALGLAVMRWLGVNIPMLFLLNALFGLYGLVWSQLVSDVLVALLSYCVYVRFRRKHALNGV